MVQCVGMPSPCAVRWVSNQMSGCSLPGRDEAADAVGEDLGAAAGERTEASVAQAAEHLLVREPGERRHVVDLARGEELQVHVGHRLVEPRDDVFVVVEADVRALAADHVDLGEARSARRCSSASATSSPGVCVYAPSCFSRRANAQNLHFTRQTFVWFK